MLDDKLKNLGLFANVSSAYTSAERHTDSITDRPDLQRVVNREAACWIVPPVLAREEKKRKIIITDPTIALNLNNIDPQLPHPIMALWEFLMDQGFEIAIWNGDGFTDVKFKYQLPVVLNNVSVKNFDKIKEALIEKHLIGREIFIADLLKTRELVGELKGEINNHRSDPVERFDDFTPAIWRDDLVGFDEITLFNFLETLPRDGSIKIAMSHSPSIPMKQYLLANIYSLFEEFNLKNGSTAYVYSNSGVISGVGNFMKNYTEVNNYEFAFKSDPLHARSDNNVLDVLKENLKGVDTFSLKRFVFTGGAMSFDNLWTILNKSQATLEELDISNSIFTKEKTRMIVLPKLKKLIMKEGKFQKAEICADALEVIDFTGNRWAVEDLSQISPLNLKVLTLDRTDINEASLVSLLLSYEHLTHLSLRNCSSLSRSLISNRQEKLGCENLTELDLFGSSITPALLSLLLMNMPALKNLNLYAFESSSGSKGVDIKQLIQMFKHIIKERGEIKIERLVLRFKEVSAQELTTLINLMPNLKELTLTNGKFILNNSADDSLPLLPEIEYLEIFDVDYPEQAFESISFEVFEFLGKLTYLKWLVLNYSYFGAVTSNVDVKLLFPELRTVSATSIDNNFLGVILRSAPKLASLRISSPIDNILSNALEPTPPIALHKLEDVYLDSNSLGMFRGLYAILNSNPHLSHLKLNAEFLELSVQDKELSKLTEITVFLEKFHRTESNTNKLPQSNISQNLSTLVSNAINLYRLNLKNITLTSPLAIPNVKILTLDKVTLSLGDFYKMMNLAKNLNYLIFSPKNIQDFANFTVEPNVIYHQLQYLDMSGVELGWWSKALRFIKNFLEICPSLTRVVVPAGAKRDMDDLSKKFPEIDFIIHSSNAYTGPALSAQPNYSSALSENDDLPYKSQNKPASNNNLPNFDSSSKNEKKVDSNTGDSDTTQQVRQIFLDKPNKKVLPNYLRLDVRDQCVIKRNSVAIVPTQLAEKNIQIISYCENQKDLLKLYHEKYHKVNDIYYGIFEVPAGANDWIALPSLTPSDVVNPKFFNSKADFTLGYSLKENLYYIKPTKPISERISVSFLVQAKEMKVERIKKFHPRFDILERITLKEGGGVTFHYRADEVYIESLSLDDKKNLLLSYFSDPNFIPGDLVRPPRNDLDLMNSIINQHKGSCKHRSMAFELLAKSFGINARAIFNDCHVFVEIQNPETTAWIMYDLGGAPSRLELLPMVDENKTSNSLISPNSADDENESTSTEDLIAKSAAKVKKNINNISLKDNPYVTWDALQANATTMSAYFEELIAASKKLAPDQMNILTKLPGDKLESFYTEMFSQAHARGNKCYFISDLDEIRDKETIIVEDEDPPFKEIDSKLIEFIKNAKPGDVLLTDWAEYSSNHVGYNTMMDKRRKIKGIEIPSGVIVIGRINTDQKMSEDFNSRFRLIADNPINVKPDTILPKKVKTLTAEQKLLTQVDFYDEDWKSVLLGKFKFEKGKYSYVNSGWLADLQPHQQVIFRNAPWHLPEFRQFMIELMTTGEVSVNGDLFVIPEHLEFVNYDSPYPLNVGRYSIDEFEDGIDYPELFLLNEMGMNQLFERYFCDKDNDLVSFPGLLKQHKNKDLHLFVTANLPQSSWAKILKEAASKNTKLIIHHAKGVSLPADMKAHATNDTEFNYSKAPKIQTRLIISSDVDYSADVMTDANVVNINARTTFSDLFEKVMPIKDSIIPKFQHETLKLLRMIKSGRPIVIKGEISQRLAKQLESLFLPNPYLMINGEKFYVPKANITFILNDNKVFTFAKRHREEVLTDDIWRLLAKKFDKTDVDALQLACSKLANQIEFSYIQLKSMLTRLKNRPHNNPLQPFMRLQSNYKELKPLASKAWREAQASSHVKPPKVANDNIIGSRTHKIMSELEHSKHLFVAGSSGVGKSSFIEDELKKCGWQVKKGMDKLKEVLQSTSDTPLALFVDEANLYEPGAFDVFEDLFIDPPSVRIDGVLIPVPDHVRFIFAGNFKHFKGRQDQRFFVRHGEIITFKEFPDSFLKEIILGSVAKELFPSLPSELIQNWEAIFLDIYHFVNQLMPDTHPLTARNLQMMLMRLPQLLTQISDPTVAACMSAFDEVSGVLNRRKHREFSDWMQHRYPDINLKRTKQVLKQGSMIKTSSFVTTKRRQNPIRILNDLFAIRDLRHNYPSLAMKGTRGLLIEGEAGIGKSHMSVEFLKSNGFKNGLDLTADEKENNRKIYYHLTPTDPNEMVRILTMAAKEGAVVIVDEINTLPLELVINALMSGRLPDSEELVHSDFLLIATQNPVTYGNRLALSTAFLNRFQSLDFKDFKTEELVEILSYLTGDPLLAEKRVNLFLEAKLVATELKKEPAPTSRHLFSLIRDPEPGEVIFMTLYQPIKDYEYHDAPSANVRQQETIAALTSELNQSTDAAIISFNHFKERWKNEHEEWLSSLSENSSAEMVAKLFQKLFAMRINAQTNKEAKLTAEIDKFLNILYSKVDTHTKIAQCKNRAKHLSYLSTTPLSSSFFETPLNQSVVPLFEWILSIQEPLNLQPVASLVSNEEEKPAPPSTFGREE